MSDGSEPTTEEKIKDALRAAPPYIPESATVVDVDMKTVLREGSQPRRSWNFVEAEQPPRALPCEPMTTFF